MMKKYLVACSATVLMFTGCQNGGQESRTADQPAKPVMESPANNASSVSTQEVMGYETAFLSDEQERYYYDIEYPVFKGGSDQSAEKISASINDRVQNQLQAFLGEFAGADHESDPGPWSLYIDYEIRRNDEAFVSIVLNRSIYTGGAHPGSYSETFNFNLHEGGKLMSLSDVFNPMTRAANPETGVVQNYLQYISEETVNELMARDISDEEMIRAGAGPDEANYRNFYLTDDDVGFIFDPYTVAPGAAGPQEITISYKDLAAFLTAYDF